MNLTKPKLKIGLFMKSFDIPSWMYLAIEKIQKSSIAEISLIILNNTKNKKFSFKNNIYYKFENIFFSNNFDAFSYKNIQKLFEDTPKINVFLNRNNDHYSFSSIDTEKISNYELDVLFITDFIKLEGKIFNIPKYGLWSYHNESNDFDGLTGISEVFRNIPVTETSLKKLNDKPNNDQILYQSFSATDLHSVIRNRNNSFWKTSSFLLRKLNDLYNSQNDDFFLNLEFNQNIDYDISKRNVPFLNEISHMLLRYGKSKFRQSSTFPQWILLYDFEENPSLSFLNFKKILPPKDRFWADPTVIFVDNLYHIFIEEFLYSKNKGHISYFTIDSSGVLSKLKIIIEKPYHLSYPFIFKYENNFFMIPETSANKTIELYKCEDFPTKWKFEKNLMENVSAVDSTLFYHDENWWLFTNMIENTGGSSWDELFLFSGDSPLTIKWIPHPKNPIVSNVRSSRPAGKIFIQNSSIIRPSQDSSKGYGYGLTFNKIEKLNNINYKEIEFKKIIPDWDKNILGVHSFDHSYGLTLIDGKFLRKK